MGLSSDDLRALDQLLAEVVDLAEDARARWLQTLPAEHAKLAPVLQQLLTGQAETAAGGGAAASAFAPGATIGRYRLVREIGAGGMGVVWLGEDGAGHLKRPVALKLPLRTLGNRAQGGRYARERDILASLAHPNIARLYDAGITADGQPFLALEYVEGEPLPAYCDARRLDVAARLALFGQVLRAVQYAHANLVIHRDLKPSNILVTADGQVRLLDFGIAKLVKVGDAQDTELTRIAGSAHTPAYASPEQIAGAPVSTASDVYSLGVLLYELLCGARPYRPATPGGAALEDAILHVDPPPPSTAVDDDAAARRAVANGRKLAAQIAGDLDTIVGKALKKRPDERYPTVAALAEDLERHLRGDPIEARADSAMYRLRKLVARNRIAFGAAATIAVALVAGTTVALWQAREARREAARASAVQQFVVDLFRANSADQLDPQRARRTTARELLDRGVARIGDAFGGQPEARLALVATFAQLYLELGLWTDAVELSTQQVTLARSLYGGNDLRVADALIVQATALDRRDRNDGADIPALLDEARNIVDGAGAGGSLSAARLHDAFAAYYTNHSLPKAREHAERAVDIYAGGHAGDPDYPLALANLANIELRRGDWTAAQAVVNRSLAVARRLGVSEFRLVQFLRRAGEINSFTDNIADADLQLREAVAISERVNGPEHPATNVVRVALQRHLAFTSRLAEAEALALQVVAFDAANPNRETTQVEDTRRMLLELHSFRGDLAAARRVADEASRAYGGAVPATFRASSTLLEIAAVRAATGRHDEARELHRRVEAIAAELALPRASMLLGNLALAQAHFALDTDDPRGALDRVSEQQVHWRAGDAGIASSRGELHAVAVAALARQGDGAAALALAAAAEREFAQSGVGQYYVSVEGELAFAHALAWLAAGDAAQALPHAERSVALYQRVHVPDSPWRANAEVAVGRCLMRLGRLAEAQAALASARAAHAAHAELGGQFRAPLREAEAELRLAESRRTSPASVARAMP
ncbi:MAG: serine/threonine-protein kinase [Burkholderiales bacterium]